MTQPQLIQFEGGDVLAAAEPLTVTGLLVPYNEVGNTNIGRFMVEAGALELPTDVSVMNATNLDHVTSDGVGRPVTVWDSPEGVMCSIKFADTEAGRAAYADAISPTGKRRKLSGEFGPAVIKAGKLVPGHAKLWGSALVEAGAFPSAMVLASDTPEEDLETDERRSPDDNGNVTVAVTDTPTTVTVEPANGEPVIFTPEAAPAEGQPEGASTVTATATPAPTAGAPAPATVLATNGAPAAPITTEERPLDIRQVYAAIAEAKANPHDGAALQVLAALVDIKISGANQLGTNAINPNWVGLLMQGIPYVQEYIGLGKRGTDISAGGKKGYKVKRGTTATPLDQFDGTWAGNKDNVKSYNGFSESASSTLHRFAIANDIAREFYDLPGGAEAIEAFLALIAEDALRWADEVALAGWIAVAGDPIAPQPYPGVDGHDYSGAMGMAIQGILAVKRRKADGRRDTPTFIIANDLAYEEMVYTPKDLIPEYITFDVNTDGSGTADGKVHIVNGETGVEETSSVIVGAGYAIEFDELAGGPLRIDALDLARGGIDKAVHAYVQEFRVRPEAVVHIGVADEDN